MTKKVNNKYQINILKYDKDTCIYSTKQNIGIPNDTAVSLLGIYKYIHIHQKSYIIKA